jgi:hypothetical protein
MSSLILVFLQRIYVLHVPRQSTIAFAHSRGEASPGSRRCHHQYLMGSLALRTVIKQWFMKDLGKIVCVS